MKEHKYSDEASLGVIAAGGTLGPIIPPSAPMIIAGMFASVSVGALFAAGIIPGLMIAGLFVTYIAIRAKLQPSFAPALPPEMRATWKEKFVVLRAVIAPTILIIAVLGGIYAGVFTPTEAAAVGALGALICVAVYRRLTWANFLEAITETMKGTAMAMWIVIGAMTFTALLGLTGVSGVIKDAFLGLTIPPLAVVALMLVAVLVLGMFVDVLTIMILTLPIFAPIATALGFDLVWFVLLFVLCCVIGYVSPPFGVNIFFLKGVLGKEVEMTRIYRAVLPFCGLMVIAVALAFAFPKLVLFVPNMLGLR